MGNDQRFKLRPLRSALTFVIALTRKREILMSSSSSLHLCLTYMTFTPPATTPRRSSTSSCWTGRDGNLRVKTRTRSSTGTVRSPRTRPGSEWTRAPSTAPCHTSSGWQRARRSPRGGTSLTSTYLNILLKFLSFLLAYKRGVGPGLKEIGGINLRKYSTIFNFPRIFLPLSQIINELNIPSLKSPYT